MLGKRCLAVAMSGALVLVPVLTAQAKGRSGSHNIPTQGSQSSQGLGSNSWTTPPGWSKAQDSNGWSSSNGQPPGWGSNTTGQQNGWGATTSPALPPGLGRRQ